MFERGLGCRLLVDLFLLRLAVQRVAARRVILYCVDGLFDELLDGDRQSAHELVDADNNECNHHQRMPEAEVQSHFHRSLLVAAHAQLLFAEAHAAEPV